MWEIDRTCLQDEMESREVRRELERRKDQGGHGLTDFQIPWFSPLMSLSIQPIIMRCRFPFFTMKGVRATVYLRFWSSFIVVLVQ